jgi:coenzyme F420-0:L-glutamate ligase / coenzyme F420-1:gamma-L-glutamate ligase
VTVEVFPVVGISEIGGGDELGPILDRAIRADGITLRDGDVVVVTQKIVSKAEGRVVPELPDGKAAWVAREARRIVAHRGDLVIAETRHGFVCANAGVDASNVGHGLLSLLPEEPDGSAERIQASLHELTGARVAVVITDTFGRPWRRGLVNVAIGVAGLPSLVDLRGTTDAGGRTLEATVVALADELAAASGLVMAKAAGIPAAVVRGVRAEGAPTPASVIVRPPDEDLFRTGEGARPDSGAPVARGEQTG